MSYPPQQGPYGQQPHGQHGGYDPTRQFGPQPGGPQPGQQGYPQPGGYGPGYGPPPQQGLPPYGQTQYGQTQYGPPSGQDPFGQPGGRPPKKKTGVIVGSVVVAVLLVGAFLFTGFVAPGFLTGDGQRDAAAGKPSSQQDKPVEDTTGQAPAPTGESSAVATPGPPAGGGSLGGSGDRGSPDPVAAAWVTGFNQHSAPALQPYTCGGTVPGPAKSLIENGRGTMVITGPAMIAGNSAKVPVTLNNKTEQMPLLKQDGQWCVSLDG
jgi:hypothetical protein